jgi:predicted GIY-YIG superfamily endonuclease
MGTSMSLHSRRLCLHLSSCFPLQNSFVEDLRIRVPNYKVYYIKCDNNAWFVGITNKSLEEKLQEHIDYIDEKLVWTRIHKPLTIHLHNQYETKEEARKDENSLLLLFMIKYGINNVRGGKFWYPILNKMTYAALDKEMEKEINQTKKISLII